MAPAPPRARGKPRAGDAAPRGAALDLRLRRLGGARRRGGRDGDGLPVPGQGPVPRVRGAPARWYYRVTYPNSPDLLIRK